MFVSASWATRKSVVSTSGGRRPSPRDSFQVDLQAFSPERRDLKADGGGQAEVVEHRGTEIVDHLPRLPDQLPHELERLVELLLTLGRTGRMVAGEGLEVLVGRRRGLGEAVVDVVGDAATLLFLGHD